MFSYPMKIDCTYMDRITITIHVASPSMDIGSILCLRNMTKRMDYKHQPGVDIYTCNLIPLISIYNMMDDIKGVVSNGNLIQINHGDYSNTLYASGVYCKSIITDNTIENKPQDSCPFLGVFVYNPHPNDVDTLKETFKLSLKYMENNVVLFYIPLTCNLQYINLVNSLKEKNNKWMTRIITCTYQYLVESS